MANEDLTTHHILAIALGPVQDFIAAARRTRDLWFGSWLLSELARAAGWAIEERYPGALIFPAKSRLTDDDSTFANKILARVPGDPAEVADAAERAVRARLERLRKDALDGLATAEGYHEDPANKQIKDLIEFDWVSAREAPRAGGYAAARLDAERLLLARKNTRLWKAPTWGLDVPKSSIDGLRESVIDESLYDQVAEGKLTAKEMYDIFRISEGERLCGVSLLKRRGLRKTRERTRRRFLDHHFLSTGHLAAGPILSRIEALAKTDLKAKLVETWKAYTDAIKEAGGDLTESRVFAEPHGHPILGAFDGNLLYENRLPDLFLSINDRRERRNAADSLRKPLKGFLDTVDAGTPGTYYAVLAADGDRMGRVIERIDEVGTHQSFSERLTGFGNQARCIVEDDHDGELIYVGGDDLLAFVPLHQAIECASALAKAFDKSLEDFKDSAGKSPTLSLGMGIAHCLEPLGRALALARDAEHDAKAAGGNSLGVRIDKRSGPLLQLVGPWGALDRELAELAKLHVRDRISDKAGFELRELGRLVVGAEGQDLENLRHIVRKETVRILARKQPAHGEAQRIEKAVRERLKAILDSSPKLEDFADRVIAARLFAEARKQAEIPRTDPPNEVLAEEVAA